jgi:tetratricopeptide (TPR) repeat protein
MSGTTNGSVPFSPVKFLYGLYDKYSERIKKQKKLLRRKWISGARLESKDMLGNRPSYKYRPRDEDEILRNMLLEEKSILVRGNALAGKTRTTFEVLKSMGSLVDVIIPLPEDIDSGDYPFADNYGMNTEIVILDDLDRFVEMSNFAKMIEVIKAKHFLIIATCQSGEKFELVNKKIDICTVFGKNIVDIGLISKGEAQRTAEREDIKWEDTEFDGAIGSVFMRLHEMRRRYDALMEREKEILRIIKKLHMCGIYEGDHLFPYALIETVYIKDHPDTELDWLRVLGPLKSSELILVSEEKKIYVEEVYLEKIVQLNEPASKLSILKEMLDTFSHNYAVLIGIGNKAFSYSLVRVQKAEYAKVAVKAYEEALQLMTADESPIQYAMVQHSLGIAYRNLASMEDKGHNLKKAISAHEEALKIYTFEEFPMDHAIAWDNTGLAYSDLASVEERKLNLKKAVEAYEAEIKVETLKEFPMQYAMARKNLGMAYTCMADVEDMDVNLEKAARSYGEALEKFENLKLSHHAEKVKNELAVIFRELRQDD